MIQLEWVVLVLNESKFYPRSQSHYKLFSSVSSMVKNIDVFTDIAWHQKEGLKFKIWLY